MSLVNCCSTSDYENLSSMITYVMFLIIKYYYLYI